MSLPASPFDPPQTPPPARSKGLRLAALVAGGLLLVPCLCCGGFAALAGRGIAMAVTERGNVESVVNEYLRKMDAKDIAGAYALFSPTAKKSIDEAQLQKLIEGQNHQLFSDFQRATVTNIQIQTSPSRTVAKVQGTVVYAGGVQGSFNGALGREGETWMIDGMYLNVPPSKISEAKSN